MSTHEAADEIVEIDLEVGHISTILPEPTIIDDTPRTHHWKIYCRLANPLGDIGRLIKPCVFHLHPVYPNLRREVKLPPFAIQGTSYASFPLSIHIYFQTKQEPKKCRIAHDLDLYQNIEGYPSRQKESYSRTYRCTFHNPYPEFRQRLLDAGGKIVGGSPIVPNSSDSNEEAQLLVTKPVIRQSVRHKRSLSSISTVNKDNDNKNQFKQPTNNKTNSKKRRTSIRRNPTISEQKM